MRPQADASRAGGMSVTSVAFSSYLVARKIASALHFGVVRRASNRISDLRTNLDEGLPWRPKRRAFCVRRTLFSGASSTIHVLYNRSCRRRCANAKFSDDDRSNAAGLVATSPNGQNRRSRYDRALWSSLSDLSSRQVSLLAKIFTLEARSSG